MNGREQRDVNAETASMATANVPEFCNEVRLEPFRLCGERFSDLRVTAAIDDVGGGFLLLPSASTSRFTFNSFRRLDSLPQSSLRGECLLARY